MASRIAQNRDPGLALARRPIAPERQAPEIRVYALGFARDRFVAPVHPGWERLVCARAGAGILRTPQGATLLDARHAAWIGHDVAAEIEARSRLDVRIAYVRRAARPVAAVSLTPLASELLERCVERGWLDPDDARDARLLGVLADEFDALETTRGSVRLAYPRDERARRAARRCEARVELAPLRAAELARFCGCSARTLERIFVRETGFGIVAWQRRLRLVHAAALLASGTGVTDAGFDAGYADTSAFVTAFRRAFGVTPGTHARGVAP